MNTYLTLDGQVKIADSQRPKRTLMKKQCIDVKKKGNYDTGLYNSLNITIDMILI